MKRIISSVVSCTAILMATAYNSALSEDIKICQDFVVYKCDTLHLGEKCFYVDGSLSDAQSSASQWIFNDMRSALDAATDGTEAQPMEIFVAPWVYWIDDPDDGETRIGENGREPIGMTVRCENLHITGLTDDARDVVLASARGQTQGAVGNFTMLEFWGNGLTVKNLTLGNFCNVDLDYRLRPELSRQKRSAAITQAHVAYCHGDKIYAENVRFISRLNMNPLSGGRRTLFNRCHMEMTDDALAPTGVYLQCTLDYYGARPFWGTDRYGAVLMDCDITLRNPVDEAFFCKGVGQVSAIDCRIHSESPVYFGWTKYPPKWLRCYQSGVKLNGEDYTIGHNDSINTIDISNSPLIQAFRTESDGKVIYNTYNLLKGDDEWDPLGVRDHFEVLGKIPTALIVTPNELCIETDGSKHEVSAQAFMHCGYATGASEITWRAIGEGVKLGHDIETSEPFESTRGAAPNEMKYEKQENVLPIQIVSKDSKCTIEGVNHSSEPLVCLVEARTHEGLEGCAVVTVLPKRVAAPEWLKEPEICVKEGVAECQYELSLNGDRDVSDVTWLRICGHDTIPVSVSRDGSPRKTYRLTASDAGKTLIAEVRPRSQRSDFGKTSSANCTVAEDAEIAVSDMIIDTDFSDFPTQPQPLIIPGAWTVDCYKPIDTQSYDWEPEAAQPAWVYGEGFNGAVGHGLLQCQRGARMLYTPLEHSAQDMEISLDVDPTKTAGQGFGSATGQYMDIYIKFDPHTLTGYALRIERTTKHSNAVDFSLVEYDQGKTKAISAPVSAVCYRTGCHINLRTSEGILYADVTTDTPVRTTEAALATEVHLSAPISPLPYSGFGIQHTGTCGENTTMLHHLQVK